MLRVAPSVVIASMPSKYIETLIQVCRECTHVKAKPDVAFRSAIALSNALASYEVEPGLVAEVRLVLDEFYGLPVSKKEMSERIAQEVMRAHRHRAALGVVCEASSSSPPHPPQPHVEPKQDQPTLQASFEADQVTTERIAQIAMHEHDEMALRGALFDANFESRMENQEVPTKPSHGDRQTRMVDKPILEAGQPPNQPTNQQSQTNQASCESDQPTDQPTPTNQASCEAETDQPTPTNQASCEAEIDQAAPTNQASCEADQATNQSSQPNLPSFEARQPTDEEVDQDQTSSQTPKTQSVAWSLADQMVATLVIVVLSNVLLKRLCQEKYVPVVFWGQDMPMVFLYVHSALETVVVTLCEVVCNLVCSLGWSVWEPVKNAKATYQQRVAWWTSQVRGDLGEDDQESDQEGDLNGLYF